MIQSVFRVGVLVLILALNLLVPARQASADSPVTIFPVNGDPYSITAGPDGNLWFTERTANKIGRITPTGVVTEFPVPTANSSLWGITAGPDGNLWFTEQFGNKIGRITPTGTITEFTIPTADSHPRGITAGPDGALWFTEWSGNKIGKITTGGSFTEYGITALANAQPNDIAPLPDGKLRFTASSRIGTIIAATGSMSLTPTQCCMQVGNVTTDQVDGDSWYTFFNTNYPKLGRVDPISNTVVEYTILNMQYAWDVTMGSDGAAWFTKFTGTDMRIGRITKTGVNTEFALPAGNYWGITTGPDGAIWFAGSGIGRIDPGGIQEYGIPLPNSEPVGVIVVRNDITGEDEVWGVGCSTNMGFEFQEGQRFTTIPIPAGCPWEIDLGPGDDDISNTTGPNGPGPQPISREPMTTTQKHGLWFTAKDSNQVGQLAVSGTVTLRTIPTANSQPQGLAYGADNAMWFTEFAGNKIGRVTITGTISEYPIPTANSNPYDIAPGPDGALWFTEYSGNKIGRITTAGIITEFALPHAASKPQSITAGPDGALWFTEGAGRIGRITTAGVITEFNLPDATSNPTGITAGKDNTLWFTLPGSNKLGRITTAGVVEEFPILTPNSYPLGIAVDSSGKVWFTQRDANQLASMTTPSAPPPPPTYSAYLPVSLKQTVAGW